MFGLAYYVIINKIKNFLLNNYGYTKATEFTDLLLLSSKSFYRLINEILKDLLISSPKPTTVYQIINKFYISESMLSVDEKMIIETIQPFNLKLIRKDRTLVISGEESDIRSALMQSMDTIFLDIEKSDSIPKI
ncbi:helix-turn-helix domain-containing protein [Staphylococcus saprophyticus]|nr:helix-turn-helix domain-containing protein [Staphylococcus saprophyticus]